MRWVRIQEGTISRAFASLVTRFVKEWMTMNRGPVACGAYKAREDHGMLNSVGIVFQNREACYTIRISNQATVSFLAGR